MAPVGVTRSGGSLKDGDDFLLPPGESNDGDRSGGSYSGLSGLPKKRKRLVKKAINDDDDDACPNFPWEDEEDEKDEERQFRFDDSHYRPITQAEYEIYKKQLQETGGFDVDVPPCVDDCDIIHHHPNFDKNPGVLEEVERCSKKAMDHYNKTYETKYKFKRVVKLCARLLAGFDHYITFEAKAEDAAPVYFQANVYAGLSEDETRVKSCRVKPNTWFHT